MSPPSPRSLERFLRPRRNKHMQQLRLGLDARCLNRQHLRGMGKYATELVERLGNYLPVRFTLLGDRPDLPFHKPRIDEAPVRLFDCRGYRFHSWEQWALPREAARLGVDLLHCPGSRLPWWQPRPTIVTLHDALPWIEDEPEWPAGWYRDRLLPRAFARCAAIITDSECSRRDIVRLWAKLEAKVHVIPLGVGETYFDVEPAPLSEHLTALGIRQPYLLYMGGRIARKRLDWALRILEALGDEPVSLVICGLEPDAAADVVSGVPPTCRSRLHVLPFLDETQMPRLYQNAVAVLYPTLYEGFGFPIVEAHAVGTPVLHSSVGSLSELAGPASVVLPVNDLDAWVQACRRLLGSRGTVGSPQREAREWARRYTWDRCAERHAEVYRSVAGRTSDNGRGRDPTRERTTTSVGSD
jgi:glycosyltransferase involved in cell wall biosynthesis